MKKSVWVILSFVLLAIILQANHFIDGDEGVVLNGAWNILNGQKIYIDFFEFIGPGSFYFVWVLFKLFFPVYWIAKLGSIIIFIISGWLIYKIYLQLSPNQNLALAAAFGWLLISDSSYPIINHNFYSSVLVIFFIYLFLKLINNHKPSLIFFCGIISALTFYFLQTKGLVIILATLFLIWLINNKNFKADYYFWYIIGLLLVFVPGFIIWGKAVLLNPFRVASNYWQINQISYLSLFIVILFIVFLFWHFRTLENNKQKIKINFLLFLQIALLISTLNRPDENHILINSIPLILLSIYVIDGNIKIIKNNKWLKTIILGTSLCVLVLLATNFWGDYKLTKQTRIAINELDIITNKEEIYTGPFLPNLYLELRKKNPYYTSVNFIETIQGNEQFLEKNLTILTNKSPQFVLTNYETVEHLDYQKNAIDDYIEANYKKLKNIGGVDVWERVES